MLSKTASPISLLSWTSWFLLGLIFGTPGMAWLLPDTNDHHGDCYNASGVVPGAPGAAGVVSGVGVAGPGGGNVPGIPAVVPRVGSRADGDAALAIVAGSGSDDVADILGVPRLTVAGALAA